MEELNIILNEDEKELIQCKSSSSSLVNEYHKLCRKIFLEQIIPYIEKNPGYKQALLKRILPIVDEGDFYNKITDFLYSLSKKNLIERRKAGNTYELVLNCKTNKIKTFISPSSDKWIRKTSTRSPRNIHCKFYPDWKERIVEYFGEDTIEIFKSTYPNLDLGYIGQSLDFEMNDALKQILEKYWTDECEKELKKYLLKWGFFADETFTLTKYGKIIGEKKVGELLNELDQHAREIQILYCRAYTHKKVICNLNATHRTEEIIYTEYEPEVKSYHIPYLYAGSFKFKWGLKPRIIVKKCKYCNENFIPIWNLSCITDFIEKNYPQIKSLNEIDFCLYHAQGKNVTGEPHSKDKMIQLLKELTYLIGFTPSSTFKKDLTYLTYLTKNDFNKALILLNDMPPYENNMPPYDHSYDNSYHKSPYGYKEVFGSWLKALIAAGILEEDSQQMIFGTKVLANDGHECLSLGEKTIDDWLYLNMIPHEKEPIYPGGYLRADWKVGKFFIEYWGLKGMEDYDKRILIKREIAKEKKIPLIEIYPEDLPNLEMKLKILKK